jgi:hypothetical protein
MVVTGKIDSNKQLNAQELKYPPNTDFYKTPILKNISHFACSTLSTY